MTVFSGHYFLLKKSCEETCKAPEDREDQSNDVDPDPDPDPVDPHHSELLDSDPVTVAELIIKLNMYYV